jgi:uncharacterized protein (TIGR02145 family)
MKTSVYLFLLSVISAFELQAQTIMNIHQNNGTVLQIPLNTIDSITYTISNPGNLASITTNAINSITGTTAISGGNITNDGGSPVTQRGICLGTSPSPTTANSTIVSGTGIGSFTCNITGLTSNSVFYVRAYAINSAGTAYGNELSFFTTNSGGIVTNPGAGFTFDGYTYSSIVLGNGQEWMAENLKTSIFANGDIIPNVADSAQWNSLTTGAWVHFDNNSQNENTYGKLYNWYTVIDSRNLCPVGWHVPTNTDWTILTDYLGGSMVAGGKMKSSGTTEWYTPNQDATNESGFSGLPGGRIGGGLFFSLAYHGFWWSSSEYNSTNAYLRQLHYNAAHCLPNYNPKSCGFSVRCLKD